MRTHASTMRARRQAHAYIRILECYVGKLLMENTCGANLTFPGKNHAPLSEHYKKCPHDMFPKTPQIYLKKVIQRGIFYFKTSTS